MELSILNKEGKETGKKVTLSDDIFGIEPIDHLMYLAVKSYRASQRTGTHKSKERNEIKGSGKKIKRQKGTGTARAGDIKNPLFKGGGRVFGPKPRDYSFKMNQKEKVLARSSALSYKAKWENIYVIEDVKLDTPKTKDYQQLLDNLGVNGKKTLMVFNELENNITLASRNLKKSKVKVAENLNTYEIMESEVLVINESAVSTLNKEQK